MFDIGAPELILILIIILVLFGGQKLPELSRSIGESIRELRKGLSGDINSDESKKTTTEKPKSSKKAA